MPPQQTTSSDYVDGNVVLDLGQHSTKGTVIAGGAATTNATALLTIKASSLANFNLKHPSPVLSRSTVDWNQLEEFVYHLCGKDGDETRGDRGTAGAMLGKRGRQDDGRVMKCLSCLVNYNAPRRLREQLVAFAFEQMNADHAYIGTTQIATLLGTGSTDGTVLDVGEHSTRVVPVVGARAVCTSALENTTIGGASLSNSIQTRVGELCRDRLFVQRSGLLQKNPIFSTSMEEVATAVSTALRHDMTALKQQFCKFSDPLAGSEAAGAATAGDEQVTLRAPDGSTIRVPIPPTMFTSVTDRLLQHPAGTSAMAGVPIGANGVPLATIPHLLGQYVHRTRPSIGTTAPKTHQNIVVCGGTTSIPGFDRALRQACPGSFFTTSSSSSSTSAGTAAGIPSCDNDAANRSSQKPSAAADAAPRGFTLLPVYDRVYSSLQGANVAFRVSSFMNTMAVTKATYAEEGPVGALRGMLV